MKINTFKLITLGFLICSTCNYSFAQSENKHETIVSIMKKQTEKKVFNDVGVPRFILIDREHKFAFGIGGAIRATTGFEFGGIVNTPINEGMQPSFIPISYKGLPHSQIRMSAATSEIFLKMVGRTKRFGTIETFVSMDFHGNNYTPNLRQAYIKLGGFTVGQAWSTMTDLHAIPPTIDYSGPISMVDFRTPLIKYERPFAEEKFKFALSIEFPRVYATYSSSSKSIPQSVPDVVGFIQHNWGQDKESHVRFSALLRNMSYYKEFETEVTQGWGVQVTSRINITRNFRFFGQGIFGKGISRYMNDPSNLNVDLVPMPYELDKGYMNTLKTWGATAGVQYNISKDVFASTSYSYNRLYHREGTELPTTMYNYAQYIVTNVFWNIISDCTLGIEYLRGTKQMFDNSFGKANRMNIVAQYTF